MLGEEAAKYHTTGYIYVVKYAGTDNRFLELDNLYKIGVATDIKNGFQIAKTKRLTCMLQSIW